MRSHLLFRKPLASSLTALLVMLHGSAACAQQVMQNPAGMTSLPRAGSSLTLETLPSNRQPLSGDMAPFDREVVKAAPLNIGSLIRIASLKPLALDGNYNRTISLEEALDYGLRNNLSIRISRESETYYNSQFYNYLSYFAPTLSSTFTVAHSRINDETTTDGNTFSNRLIFPVFNGGNHYLFALAQNYRRRGWHYATQISINDELLAIYKKYTTLVLNHQLLLVRIKAIELDKQTVDQQKQFLRAGTGTKYDLLVAEAQLASDEQAMIDQQTTTRASSLDLAYELNMPLSVNLVPTSIVTSNKPLIRGKPQISDLLKIAFNNRLELREYEYFRQAAARDVQNGMSPLYPAVNLFLAYTRSQLHYSGLASDLSGLAVTQISSGNGNTSNGTASNNALGQTANFSSSSGGGSSSSANTGSSSTVASSGGTPASAIQSGTLVTSGSVAPSIISPVSATTSGSSNINGTSTATTASPGLFNTFQAGLSLTWTLSNMGTANAANMVSLRALSRRALLQANQQLLSVEDAVRTDYTNALSVLGQIQYSASLLDTNEEALRMAQVNMKYGKGTTIDYEKAKTTYLSGLETEEQALIASVQTQAQLLHDMGVISVSTLTRGFSINDFIPRRK